MSKRGNIEFLKDIHEGIRRIMQYTCVGYSDFLIDIKTQDAVIRNIEIIGEAAKNISEDFKNRYPDIPWKNLTGARDKLIHHYFGINLEVVWYIIKDDLPPLLEQIKIIIEIEKN